MTWRDAPVTEKQAEFIGAICDDLGVEFLGKTKGEASNFISRHKEALEIQNEENRFEDELAGLAEASKHGWA